MPSSIAGAPENEGFLQMLVQILSEASCITYQGARASKTLVCKRMANSWKIFCLTASLMWQVVIIPIVYLNQRLATISKTGRITHFGILQNVGQKRSTIPPNEILLCLGFLVG